MSSGGLTAQQFNELGDEYDAQQKMAAALAAAAFIADAQDEGVTPEEIQEMVDAVAKIE